MIWRPKPGQRVTLRYRKPMRPYFPHGSAGVVMIAAAGPGPINALVKLDNCGGSVTNLLVVPRGNLFLETS